MLFENTIHYAGCLPAPCIYAGEDGYVRSVSGVHERAGPFSATAAAGFPEGTGFEKV